MGGVSRRALLALAGAGVLLGAAPGCAPPRGTRSRGEPSDTGTDTDTDAAAVAMAVASAWGVRDEAAFVAALSADTVRARATWRSWQSLDARVTADGAALAVRWRAPGASLEAVDRVGVAARGALVAHAGARPAWFDHGADLHVLGGVALLAASGADRSMIDGWTDAAAGALARLRGAALSPWREGWDGTLVVVLPADALHLARVTGVREGLESTAAVTLQPAPDAPPHVVLNPTAGALHPRERTSLLVHEGVHAVTGSAARWVAPRWLAEGLAESVACAADADRSARNVVLARRGGGVPAIDPARAPDEAAYARAQVAYEACVDRWGRETVHRWAAAWDTSAPPDDSEIGAAYAARLLRLG